MPWNERRSNHSEKQYLCLARRTCRATGLGWEGGGLLPDRKLIITRPLQGTTTTFSARQTWFACWPPYLHNPLAQLLK